MARLKTIFVTSLWAMSLNNAGNLLAQSLPGVTELAAVEITEAKLSEYAVGAKTTKFDSTVLALSHAVSLANLLNDYTTSHIKAYGNGMLSSISFRGTGPEHTAVLWHGVNISYPMLGQSDFSLIPLALTDQFLIQHGTGSSLYGSGALGGTIALSASRPENGTTASLGQWFGSFGLISNKAQISLASERSFIRIRTTWDRSNNDFSFRNTTKLGAPLETQRNAAFELFGLDMESGLSLGDRGEIAISAQYVDMDRQLQPNMNALNSTDKQADNNIRLRTRYSFNRPNSNWYLQYAYLTDEISYNGSLTRSVQHVVRANFDGRLAEKMRFSMAADHSLVGVEAEFYTGEQVAETRTNIWGSLLALPTSWLTLSANLRQAFHPVYRAPLSPSIGAEILLQESTKSKHQISVLAARGFRIPTLNELYWNPGGNLDLVPEDSYSAEIGYGGEVDKGFKLSYQITGYRMWVENWILWQPNGSFWTPQNIKKVDVYGLEFSGSVNHPLGQAQLSWQGNYGYTRSINQSGLDQFDRSVGKQLSYTPVHKGSLTGNLNYTSWSFSINGVAIGKRFTTADNENYLPAYFLLNMKAAKKINLGKYSLDINTAVNNLLDTSYQSVVNRAMPGINYLLGINLTYANPAL